MQLQVEQHRLHGGVQVMGDNLLALIRLYDHRGLPLPVVRNITRQVLIALDYLHITCKIIHTGGLACPLVQALLLPERPPPPTHTQGVCSNAETCGTQ